MGGASGAQGHNFVVSTSADLAPSGGLGAVDDGDLVAVGGGPPTLQFTANHWLAQVGFQPTDVDAFARLESFSPGHARSFVFSLQANQAGWLDGDVLTFTTGGGVQILYSEDMILAGLGLSGGNVDVDACDLDDQGRLVFSLQSDATGTLLGTVEDGDVLRLEFDGSVSLLASEAAVQTSFSVATGLGDAVGDVLGLACVNGEIWVVVQSPSSHDGGILALGTGARIVAKESDLGLGGAELDALSLLRPGDELASVTASATQAAPGDTVHFTFTGPPGEVFLVVKAGTAGFLSYPGFSGFGGFYVDPTDPWLTSVITSPAGSVIVLDGTGRFEIDYALPPGPLYGLGLDGTEGWTLQLLSAAGEVSAPIRIQRL